MNQAYESVTACKLIAEATKATRDLKKRPLLTCLLPWVSLETSTRHPVPACVWFLVLF